MSNWNIMHKKQQTFKLAQRNYNESDGFARDVTHWCQLIRIGQGEEREDSKAVTLKLLYYVYNVHLAAMETVEMVFAPTYLLTLNIPIYVCNCPIFPFGRYT
jgi:hypothetical protein